MSLDRPAPARRRPVRALALALAAVLAHAALPSALPAQFTKGQSILFHLASSEDGPTEGRMHVAGDRARLEIEDHDDGDGGPSYFLLTEGGRTIVTVHPARRSYSEMDARALEKIVGRAMRAVDAVVTMDMVESRVSGERLGPGEPVAGLATERYRVTQEFTIHVGAFGETERQRHKIVTDYWVNPEANLPRNPILELLASAHSALAQSNADFVAATERERARLFTASPLRVSVHAEEHDADGDMEMETLEYEVLRILPATIDQRALRVPREFSRTSGKQGLDIDW